MKLDKIYSYDKIMRRWKNGGSAIQLTCRNILFDLDLAKSLDDCKLYLGGLISIGDGSLDNKCEVYVKTKIPWVYVCGDILYTLLVEKSIIEAGICVYDDYVDIICTIDDIEFVIRLCTYTKSLRSWWIYDYLFNEVLLAPARTEKLKFLIKCGADIKDSYDEILCDLNETAVWDNLKHFATNLDSKEIKKVIYLRKGVFGWKRSERGIVSICKNPKY